MTMFKRPALKSIIRVCMDVVLITVLSLLISFNLTGIALHEVLGLIFCAAIIGHGAVNYKWLFGISKKLFVRKLKPMVYVNYILNILMLTFIVIVTITGLRISMELFPLLRKANRGLQDTIYLHKAASYATLVLAGIHTGLNWKWLMRFFGSLFNIKKPNKVRTVILNLLTAVAVFFGIKAHFDMDMGKSIAKPVTGGNRSEVQSDRAKDIKVYNPESKREDITVPVLNAPGGDNPALKEYLSKIWCRGCGVMSTPGKCTFANPNCALGKEQYTQVLKDYFEVFPITPKPTLNEFLSQWACTGCARFCPLSALGCAAEPSKEYYTLRLEKKEEYKRMFPDLASEVPSIEPLPKFTPPSLEQFLGGSRCTQCAKRCPLTNTECMRGDSKITTETKAYYEKYKLIMPPAAELEVITPLFGFAVPEPITGATVMSVYIAGAYYLLTFGAKAYKKTRAANGAAGAYKNAGAAGGQPDGETTGNAVYAETETAAAVPDGNIIYFTAETQKADPQIPVEETKEILQEKTDPQITAEEEQEATPEKTEAQTEQTPVLTQTDGEPQTAEEKETDTAKTQKPKSTVAKPKTTSAKPKTAAAKPKTATIQPKVAAAKPKASASKPKPASAKTSTSRTEALEKSNIREKKEITDDTGNPDA